MSEPHLQGQLDRLYRRIRTMVAPVKINTTDDAGSILRGQISINGTPEIIDNMPLMQHYGFHAVPPKDTDATALFIGGDRSNPVIVGTNNQQFKPKNYKPGELGQYTDEGDSMKFSRDRQIAINAGNQFGVDTKKANIKGSDNITLDSPLTDVTKDLKAKGIIDAAGGFFKNGVPIGDGGGGGGGGITSVTLTGDVIGSGTDTVATTVVALQHHAVLTTAPADKQVLTWSAAATAWTPAPTQQWLVGPGLALDTGTTPSTIDVATPYLPLSGGSISGALQVAGITSLSISTATTPPLGDNSIRIATTAFVKTQGYQIGNQTITISGDASGSGTTAIPLTLATVNSNVGTFQGLTVNAKGQVTAASNQNYLTGNQTITLSGDISGSGTTAIPATVTALQGRPVAATAPTSNQVLQWNGSTWTPATPAASGGLVTVGDTPPPSPISGTEWWDSVGGQLYVWFDDPSADTGQWVAATNSPGPQGPAGPQGPNWQVGAGLTLNTGTTPSTISLTTPAVAKTGDTMSGPLTIAGPASQGLTLSGASAQFILNKTGAGQVADVIGYYNNNLRWAVVLGDASDNYTVVPYNDAGATVGAGVFSITRLNGYMKFGEAGFVCGGASATGGVQNVGNINFAVPNGLCIENYSNNAPLLLNRPGNGTIITFFQTTTYIPGSISIANGTTTSYNTTSDGRLKEDLRPFDAGPMFDAINVYDFKWKSNGLRAHGVIAQDAQEVFEDAFHYDEANDVWQVDYSKFVPSLINEVKALRARVATLEAAATERAQ